MLDILVDRLPSILWGAGAGAVYSLFGAWKNMRKYKNEGFDYTKFLVSVGLGTLIGGFLGAEKVEALGVVGLQALVQKGYKGLF